MHEWLTSAARANAEGRDLDYIVTIGGFPVGSIGARGLSTGPELGYWLARPFWGLGYMSEAARCLIEHLFDRGHFFITSGVLAGNGASLRVQEKLGFRPVNERYVYARPHGKLMPHIDTVLGRGRWTHVAQAA